VRHEVTTSIRPDLPLGRTGCGQEFLEVTHVSSLNIQTVEISRSKLGRKEAAPPQPPWSVHRVEMIAGLLGAFGI
jgi:hypothetical protein